MDNAKQLVALADEQYNRGSFGAARVNYLEAIEALEKRNVELMEELTRSQASAVDAVRRVAQERDEIERNTIERCAKVCEEYSQRWYTDHRSIQGDTYYEGKYFAADECAETIRALSSPIEQIAAEPKLAAARKLYNKWVDNQGIHCNRFPGFGELSAEEQNNWIDRACHEVATPGTEKKGENDA